MAAFNFRRRQTRRWWLAGTTMVVLAAGILLFVASASGTLTTAGGTFDTSNGSLYSATYNDWNPPNTKETPTSTLSNNKGPVQPIDCTTTPGTNCALDLVGSKVDNALGQGTKEDDVNVSIVDGSIPPQKDDLSRFYINQQTATQTSGIFTKGDNLLYLAWERSNLLGSAHMDFELNQNPVGIDSSTTGSLKINRTPGDVLIDFDFGGSGLPTLVWHKWLDSTNAPTGVASADCEASTTFPCWGKSISIGSAGEASVNGAVVYDYNPPSAPTTLNGTTTTQNNKTTVSSTFGEAGIDLQASGIFSSFQCTRFGDAWLKSRSSGNSFTSELKDFIAPLPVNISNCGEIKIIKNTDPAHINQDFAYTTSVPSGTGTTAIFSTTPDSTGSTTGFTLNDRNDVLISSVTTGDPDTTVTTNKANGLANGDNVTITGSSSYTTPSINGTWEVSNVSGNSFTIPFATTAVGSTPAGSLVYDTEDITNVAPGSYTVNETMPNGWSLGSLTCVPSDTSGANFGVQHSTGSTQADITVAADGLVTCTYVNKPNLGAIVITKSATKIKACTGSGTPTIGYGVCTGSGTGNLSGAHFKICTNSGATSANCTAPSGVTSNDFTTGSNGTVCLDNLSWSHTGTTYYVVEFTAPTGFALDSTSTRSVSVTQNASCSSTTNAATVTFSDAPLTNLVVTATAQAHDTNNTHGATQSKITCATDDTTFANTVGTPVTTFVNPAEMDATGTSGLTPGTYYCKIVIDP